MAKSKQVESQGTIGNKPEAIGTITDQGPASIDSSDIDIDMEKLEEIARAIPKDDDEDQGDFGTTESEEPDEESTDDDEEVSSEDDEATEPVEDEEASGEPEEQTEILSLADVEDKSWQNLSKLRNEGKAGPDIIQFLKSVEPTIHEKFREADKAKKEKSELEKLVSQLEKQYKREEEFRQEERRQKEEAARRQQEERLAELKETDPDSYERHRLEQELSETKKLLKQLNDRVAATENQTAMQRIQNGIKGAVTDLRSKYPYVSDRMAKRITEETEWKLNLRWQQDAQSGVPFTAPETVAEEVFRDVLDDYSPEELRKHLETRPELARLKQEYGKQSVNKVFKKKKQGGTVVPSTKHSDSPEVPEEKPPIRDIIDMPSTEELLDRINKKFPNTLKY